MKLFQRTLLAMLLIAALLVTMAPALAVVPNKDAKAAVTITGLGDKTPTIKLYKVVDGEYTDGGLKNYKLVHDGDFADLTAPTMAEVSAIANTINGGTHLYGDAIDMTVADGTATAQVSAGTYIAIITAAAGDDTVYNPVVLSASWVDEEGSSTLSGGTAGVGDNYSLQGGTSTAKSSTPDVDKEITDGSVEDTIKDKQEDTAKVGDVLTYTVSMKPLPQYPEGTVNKTLFATDTLSEGLTFQYETLALYDGETKLADLASDAFVSGGTTLGNAKKDGNGFNINFNYDAVKGYTDLKVVYKAVINDKAVIGLPGNDNTFKLQYAQNPNKGETHKTTDKPTDDEAKDLKTIEDKEVVYTYRLALKKTDDAAENPKALAGAEFGVYADAECTKLIDRIVTNDKGYAESNQVGKGTYYVKELKAPEGYTLNTAVTPVDATWATATTKKLTYTASTKWTTDKTKAVDETQAGWILDGVFYALDDKPAGEPQAAYVAEKTELKSGEEAVTTENEEEMGAVNVGTIKDTKLSELPSTGGNGGMMITVGGILAMLLAAFAITRMKKTSKAK